MDREKLIDELLDRWEEQVEAGDEPKLNELCRDHPELIPALASKISALRIMQDRFHRHEMPNTSGQADSGRGPRNGPDRVDVSTELVDLRYHDRGGLGIVYRARDHRLNRDVAVKFLHRQMASRPADQKIFQQEAEITGRLDHPGVVPVYALGQTDRGQPFYVMRFIRGDTYDDAIQRYHAGRLSMPSGDQRVAMQKLLLQLVSACQTIAYAHTRGIVHRDLKPQNIMLGKYGETLVLDWGLAIPFTRAGQFRVLDEKTLVPEAGNEKPPDRHGEGTLLFMSPEQAAGRDELGPATDIYSLGVVLYRVLTGKFAFDGDSPVEIRSAIIRGKFPQPRQLDATIPRALESICLKAMALNSSQRYETAMGLADDLSNYLADGPVTACQYTIFEKIGRWVRRHQVWFTALVATGLIVALASMGAATRFYAIQSKLKRTLAVAEVSQLDSLAMTCRMTARSIQYNLEARLITLEEFAADPESVLWISDWTNDDHRQQLQTRLEQQRNSIQQRLPSVSWFILDPRGELICRAADDKNFPARESPRWIRPYFHGGEYMLDSEADAIPEPLSQPKLSPVFFGQYQDVELCSLSVPVVGPAGGVIGVLVMTIPMGQFDPLIVRDSHANSSYQRFATLVETRGELKGALLHHPGLEGMTPARIRQARVCDSVFEAIMQIDCLETDPQPISDYVDPLEGAFSGEWHSVALPIPIRSKDGAMVACGWYLLVQDRRVEGSKGTGQF